MKISKQKNTEINLKLALERILNGNTEIVSPHQKLSIRAVEQEAGLGSGSIYYYKEIVLKIKNLINEKRISPPNDYSVIKIKKLKIINNKRKKQIIELKQKMSIVSKNNIELIHESHVAQRYIEELEAKLSNFSSL